MKYIFLILFTFLVSFDGFSQEDSKEIKDCDKEKTTKTILAIKDFLNSKGYEVQTDGDLTVSLKKEITCYYIDQGFPIHTLPENAFEIDTQKINEEYRRCISTIKE